MSLSPLSILVGGGRVLFTQRRPRFDQVSLNWQLGDLNTLVLEGKWEAPGTPPNRAPNHQEGSLLKEHFVLRMT